MADMDSPGAGNRQAPSTVRRNVAPAKPVVPRRSTPKPARKKKVYRTNSGSSSGNHGSSHDYRGGAVQRKASGGSSRKSSGGNKPIRKTTPVLPQKPTAKVIEPPAPPKPPSNADWLRSDSTYQRQLAGYAKALSDFNADQLLQRGDYQTGYANTRRDIGLAKDDAAHDLENDYAARGLLRSSLYNDDLGKLNQEYQNQYTDLDKQRTAFLDQLTQGLTSFRNEQSVQQQNAQAEALRRRAEKYNL